MPTLLTEGHRGGAGGINDTEVGFDDPDQWDEAAADLVKQAAEGEVGGVHEPEVVGGRAFVPEQLGGGILRAFKRAGVISPVGNIATAARDIRYQRIRKVPGGWIGE